MEVLYSHCAGLDVHKKTVVCCRLGVDAKGHKVKATETFGTTTAELLADLLQHGLLKASFIPPMEQRDRRDLTRQRTQLVRDRASVLNRIQKVLEGANIKLSSVVSEISGVSSRAILE